MRGYSGTKTRSETNRSSRSQERCSCEHPIRQMGHARTCTTQTLSSLQAEAKRPTLAAYKLKPSGLLCDEQTDSTALEADKEWPPLVRTAPDNAQLKCKRCPIAPRASGLCNRHAGKQTGDGTLCEAPKHTDPPTPPTL